MGVALVGVLLYFSVRRLRRQPQKDSAHKGSSPGPIWYEKPELTGEDACKEMDTAERRTAELAGDETGVEMDAAERRTAELAGVETGFEMDGTPARHMGNLQAI